MSTETKQILELRDVMAASEKLQSIVVHSPLERNYRLSKKYDCDVYLKREDLQIVRSYKIRGAYNFISSLDDKQKEKGIVCASAGNHAQGVAYSCSKLKIHGKVYMPQNTPKQKVQKAKELGGKWVEVILVGDTFDDAKKEALKYSAAYKVSFVHPFNDPLVIAGQATVGKEIVDQIVPDVIVGPIGGGGLMSGISFYIKSLGHKTEMIGVEPKGSQSMIESVNNKCVVVLENIDTFVDGAAVREVGDLTFRLCNLFVDSFIAVPEGKVCGEMIDLYQSDGIVAEPAGALSISALESIKDTIKGKKVVCIISGGNNDITRYPEIMERSLIYKGLKHYFLIEFSQRPGALRNFLEKALTSDVDITMFEYVKKNNKEFGPALVGLELAKKEELEPLLERMNKIGLKYQIVEANSPLFEFIV